MTRRTHGTRKAALRTTISMLALTTALAAAANAQAPAAQSVPQGVPQASTDIGSVDVQGATVRTQLLPIASPAAVGSKAPPGSAPALAPAQGSLEQTQPGSIVSDKVIRDIVPPSSDYNETVKFTPGWTSNNANGLLGDAKGGWRGFADGQYNITYDGIPFGDANDPSHHSAA